MKRNSIIWRLTAFIMAAACAALITSVDVEGKTGGTKEVIDGGQQTLGTDPDTGRNGIINFEERTIEIEDDGEDADTLAKRRGLPSMYSAVSEERYDPRSSEEDGGRDWVKDQGNSGLCWAFTAATAAEREAAMEDEGVYSALSPAHLGYFMYHRVNDPLGRTAGDKNVIGDAVKNYMDIGGNNMLTFQVLANWTGLALEETEEGIDYENPYHSSNLNLFTETEAYDNAVILEEARFLNDRTAIKAAILENGSVLADYYDTAAYYNEATDAYYSPSKPGNNHAVTIVGWDDAFPAANFLAGTQPSQDGAWIVQNSWGTDPDGTMPRVSEDGYFYISYEDASLSNAMTIDVQPADTYDYNYQYDGNANISKVEFLAGEQAANIFPVSEKEFGGSNQFLEAIGFTVWNTEAKQYVVEIYTDVTGTNPTDGVLACAFDVTTEGAGFHTFRLDEAGQSSVYLEPGTNYSIVVKPVSNVHLGVESAGDYDWISFECNLAAGQSYYRTASSPGWYDAYEDGFCLRIKGYASGTDEIVEATGISFVDAEDGVISLPYDSTIPLKIRFMPGNATERKLAYSHYDPAVIEVFDDGRCLTAMGQAGDETTLTAVSMPTGDGAGHTTAAETQAVVRIVPADMADVDISLSAVAFPYDGKAHRPMVTAKHNGKTLIQDVDYKVEYRSNVYPGTASVAVMGIGNYTGTAPVKTFSISAPVSAAPKSAKAVLYGYDDVKFSWSKVSGASGYDVYYKKSSSSTWKHLKSTTKTYVKKKNLADGAKYHFKVVPYQKLGDGKVYQGKGKKSSGIYTLKKVPNVKAGKASRKYVKIKWKNIQGESGYQIYRSKYKSKKFSKVKTVKAKASSAKIKAAKGQKYYYKVRAYKKVDGKTIYGPWSKVKGYRVK